MQKGEEKRGNTDKPKRILVPHGSASHQKKHMRADRTWKDEIKNEGFNAQKKHGYGLEHLYSRNYQALKNHYYLIQIGHMISQCMEAWGRIWKKVEQSIEQKRRKLLESMKETPLEEHKEEIERKIQIRFI